MRETENIWSLKLYEKNLADQDSHKKTKFLKK